MSSDRFDLHQHVTDQIVLMLERSQGEFHLPWQGANGMARPVNVVSSNPYRGVNILALWATAYEHGYQSGFWGTYRQWAGLGAHVRKGEKAAYVVFYKDAAANREMGEADEGSDSARTFRRLVTRASPVFAAEQVEGYQLPSRPPRDPILINSRAEAFVAATDAKIVHEGHRAFYRPSTDSIHLPVRDAFIGTPTSSPSEAYYSTLLHELTHWTGHEARCNRQLGGRFGPNAYAMEELIAELGAAFLCADLQITGEPRPDHAHYLASWLTTLRQDKRAIFTAASKASAAVAILTAFSPDSRPDPIRLDAVRSG